MSSSGPDVAPGRLGHVPALDGLRGLAVIAVLVYHEGSSPAVGSTFGWAHGGFIGVDLFFVLSGFLITTLLLIERERGGRVIAREFWARRARRLLPALFVFLVMIAVYSRVYAAPYELGRLRRGSLATLFYFANYWQLRDPLESITIPLGHVWSLSIEEQFYIVWPFALAGLLLLARGRVRILTGFLGALVIGSAVWMAVQYTPGDPWPVYLATQTRAFALLIGALLAVALRSRNGPSRPSWAALLEVAGCLALAALAVVVFAASFDDDWLYRGGLLAIAVTAAVCIAAAVQPASPVLGRVLSWRPLCAVGLVSYGLYLYSIPIYFVIGPDHVGLRGYALFAARLAVLGAVATVSFVLVERPIRRNTLKLPRLRFTAPAAFASVAAVLLVATAGETAVPSRVVAASAYEREAATAPPGAIKVLVAGDPLAYGLAMNTAGSYTGLGIRGTTATSLACALTADPIVLAQVLPLPTYCSDLADSVRNAMEAFEPDITVLMAGPDEVYDRFVAGKTLRFGTPEFEQYLDRQLDQYRRLLRVGTAPLVLLTVPCMHPTTTGGLGSLAAIQADPTRTAWLNDVWRRYAERRAGTVRLADYNAFLCPRGRSADASAMRLRAGGVTLSPAGAVATWQWLARVVTPIVDHQPAGSS